MGRQVLWLPSAGPLYADLLLAWTGVLVGAAAWPRLWTGLRGLTAYSRRDGSAILAWHAFLLTVIFVIAAAVLLPLQYAAFSSGEPWFPLLYMTAFPFLPWVFVPLLVLHAVLFGRVANFVDAPSRHIVDFGGLLLFAVAAASTAVILQHPGASSFVRSWSVGGGLLPLAAFAGYAAIAVGLTLHAIPVRARARHEIGHPR